MQYSSIHQRLEKILDHTQKYEDITRGNLAHEPDVTLSVFSSCATFPRVRTCYSVSHGDDSLDNAINMILHMIEQGNYIEAQQRTESIFSDMRYQGDHELIAWKHALIACIYYYQFDAKGNVKGVRDMEIVDYLVENVRFFVVGITPYYYEHGVFLEDHDGVRMKYRIQKLIYRDQVQSGVIKRIYNLLITQPKVHREAYELNKQPVRWINFKNGYYDPVTGEMLEHNPDYLTINQIPFPYYPEDREQVLQGGENIKKYLASSLPNKEEQQTFWEYFGYCMTQDTQFQKFVNVYMRRAGSVIHYPS